MANLFDYMGFRVALLGGCAGIVLDLDHIPEEMGYSLPVRPLHLVGGFFTLVFGLVYVYSIASNKRKMRRKRRVVRFPSGKGLVR